MKTREEEEERRSPCSLICRICFTVSLRMAHLSGLTLRSSMSLMLAKISSASSSMYRFSCSRFLLSVLLFGLRGEKRVGRHLQPDGSPTASPRPRYALVMARLPSHRKCRRDSPPPRGSGVFPPPLLIFSKNQHLDRERRGKLGQTVISALKMQRDLFERRIINGGGERSPKQCAACEAAVGGAVGGPLGIREASIITSGGDG
ncbi:hypothetical protein EYF80_048088 [Liparis tanakae]|uniref:Uncharacterized protein n=1 Tax=Liparis tanakae TaxID=230148 RepID=A0A4Z2FLW6_9TELE|nr:hypothetical protein EYF80_048088 [Liparis tanakae]